ncbi:antibiotic biosynthesis monooxygenase family protein [Nocardia sp. NPDC020380]|uniref:antibiotic biosynthesis monooxygenase family protein n=1 Tax=unclassified Nocardia TaxID=2637762 RepID=UPI0037A81C29
MAKPIQHTMSGLETPVTLINAFSVPMSQEALFLEHWKANARCMSGAPGFLRARMHRAVSEQAELTYINVAEWESGLALDEARRSPEWLESVRAMNEDPGLTFTARPMPYQVVVDVAPGDPVR